MRLMMRGFCGLLLGSLVVNKVDRLCSWGLDEFSVEGLEVA